MSEIFIAYAGDDSAYASDLKNKLLDLGHNVVVDRELFRDPADQWRSRLGPALRKTDLFVPIISKFSTEGGIFEVELLAALSYSHSTGRMAVVPVRIDDSSPPEYLDGVVIFDVNELSVADVAAHISKYVSSFVGKLLASQQQAADVAEKVEANLAEYLDEAVTSQSKLEKQNWISGTIWYVLGILALAGGAASTFFAVSPGNQVGGILSVSGSVFKSIAVVGFLGAGARYCFVLGKSYLNESLKNSDRIHAIQFGRFYLRAFGNNTTWQELREVFANWNISNSSSFASLRANDVDPKVLESIGSFMKSISKKE